MTDLKLITEPTVHLIGRTKLDLNAVDDFLDGRRWEHTSHESTELISELAGRVCYMSFGEKQGRRTTEEYLRNILESGQGVVHGWRLRLTFRWRWCLANLPLQRLDCAYRDETRSGVERMGLRGKHAISQELRHLVLADTQSHPRLADCQLLHGLIFPDRWTSAQIGLDQSLPVWYDSVEIG